MSGGDRQRKPPAWNEANVRSEATDGGPDARASGGVGPLEALEDAEPLRPTLSGCFSCNAHGSGRLVPAANSQTSDRAIHLPHLGRTRSQRTFALTQ